MGHSSTQILCSTSPICYTISPEPNNRSDSALGLLSDIEYSDNDDMEQQESFDRIYSILSDLIQEANEAVHDGNQERVSLSPKKSSSSSLSNKSKTRQLSDTRRTRKTKISHLPRKHTRHPSSSSISSASSNQPRVSSPIATSSSSSTSLPSPVTLNRKALFRHTPLRSKSTPINSQRRSQTPRPNKRTRYSEDSVTASFQRLNDSIALVSSLSQHLVTTEDKTYPNLHPLLLLVPLLHIPHSLITMIFDFCTAGPFRIHQTSPFNLTTMVFWTCLFTVTNFMVDQVRPERYLSIKTKRVALPGSF
ncbi:hypothetical protein G6F47_010195 [Rhizopus delemar]|nr:hypothetical protein G6F54_010189 [Rhizopus delemar]KAG1500554.1 hypothetical protein G6F53_011278 [Rhizopus delemar]KAG1589973.1 hypothetical protein G6F47_010195 [Rhizopus delemar]